MVFEILAKRLHDGEEYACRTFNLKIGFTEYSVVSKEWQAYFEPRLYRHLELSWSSLDAFQKVKGRQKALIEHICFHIGMPRYEPADYRDCSDWVSKGASGVFTGRAIVVLFSILNQWDRDQVSTTNQLVLEIVIDSPETSHDSCHLWDRLRQDFYQERFNPSQPVVDVVTHFIIPRHFLSNLSSHSLQVLFKSLPNLVSINYDSWLESTRDLKVFNILSEYYRDSDYWNLFIRSLPDTLKTLNLFEDVIWRSHIDFIEKPPPPEPVRTSCSSAGATIAWRSLRLEKLAAYFVVEAEDFFKARQPEWIWHNLKSLTLTSQLLAHVSTSSLASAETLVVSGDDCLQTPSLARINEMLVEAGAAALQMPSLETMEIWSEWKRNACVFRYQSTAGLTTLIWCDTWGLELDSAVVDAWKRVAKLNSRHEFIVSEN